MDNGCGAIVSKISYVHLFTIPQYTKKKNEHWPNTTKRASYNVSTMRNWSQVLYASIKEEVKDDDPTTQECGVWDINTVGVMYQHLKEIYLSSIYQLGHAAGFVVYPPS